MNRPWMPLYIGDYLGDTGHLTTTQHGAYLLLMMHYWRKGELPDDNQQLAAITGMTTRQWSSHRSVLQAFFFEGWHHKRIDTELAKMNKLSVTRSRIGYEGGMKSALSRMKIENKAQSQERHQPSGQANSKQISTNCFDSRQPEVDYSHSHKKDTTTVSVEREKRLGNGITQPCLEIAAILRKQQA